MRPHLSFPLSTSNLIHFISYYNGNVLKSLRRFYTGSSVQCYNHIVDHVIKLPLLINMHRRFG